MTRFWTHANRRALLAGALAFVAGAACAAYPDRGGKQIPEFAFCKLLHRKFGNDRGIFSAQGAAGLFDLFDHLALARFKVGEAFSVGHLGHVHRPLGWSARRPQYWTPIRCLQSPGSR